MQVVRTNVLPNSHKKRTHIDPHLIEVIADSKLIEMIVIVVMYDRRPRVETWTAFIAYYSTCFFSTLRFQICPELGQGNNPNIFCNLAFLLTTRNAYVQFLVSINGHSGAPRLISFNTKLC